MSDGQGLFLLIKPNGAKWWRFRYRFGLKQSLKRGQNTEKEKLLSCGVYPEVSLSEARKRRDKFRAQLRDRIDPGAELRAAKLATVSTLAIIAEEYLLSREKPAKNDKRAPLSAKTIEKQRYFLETFVLPSLGSVPIGQITVPELFTVLKKLDDRGVYETRKKTQELCGKIWRYAVVSGRHEILRPIYAAPSWLLARNLTQQSHRRGGSASCFGPSTATQVNGPRYWR